MQARVLLASRQRRLDRPTIRGRSTVSAHPGILQTGHSLDLQMDSTWLLLIYTVPAEPTRKRASVWREVKKLGALYLRDGVCILPERSETIVAAGELAARIGELDGQAMIVRAARLDPAAAKT